ncbi:MAG: hypothetical protein KAJ24_06975, partial [Candidatus Aenigmarchaeota archaeon]|nr:hypothetical protein [Candidatus Aenigmarchaeota archaeon]
MIFKTNKRSAFTYLFLLFFIAGIFSLPCNANAGFYAPMIEGDMKTESNITIYVRNSSIVTQPKILYRFLNSTEWNSCTLSFFAASEMNCTIFAENITVQGVYEFYFNSTEGRFPEENATLKIALSKRSETYLLEGQYFAVNSSEVAHVCDAWSTSNSCGYETWQAGMIDGYWTASMTTNNSTYEDIAYSFSLSEYETLSFYSTCDHADADYDCENCNSNDPNNLGNLSLIPSGSMRQASLISSLWNAVQYGANTSVRDLAWNYTIGSAQDCNVWGGVFNCTYPERQGAMILAYWKAYEMTGNQTIKEIAENLSFYGALLNESHHSYMAQGMWKAYEMTGN